MKVRHVHAKPGEYIAVHRQHSSGSTGYCPSSKDEGTGCLSLIAIGFAIWLVVNLWEVLMVLAIVGGAGWLIWTFRRPLWTFVCWTCTKLGHLFSTGHKGKQSCISGKQSCISVGNIPQNTGPTSKSGVNVPSSSDYGKIRQHHR